MKEGEVYGMTKNDLEKLLLKAGFFIKSEKKFMLGVNNLTIAKKKVEKV